APQTGPERAIGRQATGRELTPACYLRWRMRERMRRFLRPSLRRPLPDFLTPTSHSKGTRKDTGTLAADFSRPTIDGNSRRVSAPFGPPPATPLTFCPIDVRQRRQGQLQGVNSVAPVALSL